MSSINFKINCGRELSSPRVVQTKAGNSTSIMVSYSGGGLDCGSHWHKQGTSPKATFQKGHSPPTQ